ncbi:hypothetical protein N782_10660 [Pontibacillus yanchengensis Y32]|uniref:Uncharacterized protein n=1 Tax=Pontibacillus yanchengensis Y32 TaxID=1385514 RepID=A0A0A2TF61_9BACI|nr:hypothetical protein N782_10660 [Pontibacillus yanchengensis Y32]
MFTSISTIVRKADIVNITVSEMVGAGDIDIVANTRLVQQMKMKDELVIRNFFIFAFPFYYISYILF